MRFLCIPEHALRSIALGMNLSGLFPEATIECYCNGIRAMDIVEGEVVTDEEYRSERALPGVSLRAVNSGS